MKCIVKDCENHTHQGAFVGVLCMPCHTFLTTGEGKYSQLYRNTVAAEREACAQICEDQMEWGEINRTIAIAAGNCADLIRERGQS